MENNLLARFAICITAMILAGCASNSLSNFAPASTHVASGNYNNTIWQGSANDIWDEMQHISVKRLQALQSQEPNPEKNAWIQLALISKIDSANTQQLAANLLAWQKVYPSHPANSILPSNGVLTQMMTASAPQHIAVLLPQSGNFAASGQAVRAGLMRAYFKNHTASSKQSIKFYDTNKGQSIAALYNQAVNEGADFIVGPLLKDNVQQLENLGSVNLPTLSLNYTNHTASNVYQFGLAPEDESMQIADRAHATGVSHAIVIAPNNDWGKRMVEAFSLRWKMIGGNIEDSWYFTPKADFSNDIAKLMHVNPETDKKLMHDDNNKQTLESQRRQDVDVIFIFAQPQDARAIVPLLHYYYAGNVPMYASASVYSGKANPAKDVDLNGVMVCDIPRKGNASASRLEAVGEDAYLLSSTLQRLIQLPNFPIYGNTGALTMTAQNQIHRRVPCEVVQNGLLAS